MAGGGLDGDGTGSDTGEDGVMESEFVTLEQAQRLKAAGFPQDQWPQHGWYRPINKFVLTWEPTDPKRGPFNSEWYAAPSYLLALQWLEGEKGIGWGHSPEAAWYYIKGDKPVWWHSLVELGNPHDLLDAMLDYLRP